jgi:hypothetical protein
MEGSGARYLSSWGLSWAKWSRRVYRGICEMAVRGSEGGVSLYGSSGKRGRGPLLGTLEDR